MALKFSQASGNGSPRNTAWLDVLRLSVDASGKLCDFLEKKDCGGESWPVAPLGQEPAGCLNVGTSDLGLALGLAGLAFAWRKSKRRAGVRLPRAQCSPRDPLGKGVRGVVLGSSSLSLASFPLQVLFLALN